MAQVQIPNLSFSMHYIIVWIGAMPLVELDTKTVLLQVFYIVLDQPQIYMFID